MGWSEWPLIFFTVMAQSAVGAFWICALVILFSKSGADSKLRLERNMLFIWLLVGLGFLCSSAHLGSPFRAFNAFFRIGQAPLSNEAFFGACFIAFGGFAWLVSVIKPGMIRVRKVFYGLALLLSIMFIWNMTTFYLMPAVPTWNNPFTPTAYFLTMVLGGCMTTSLIFALANFNSQKILTGLAVLGSLAFLAIICHGVLYVSALQNISSAIHKVTDLSPDIGFYTAVRMIFLAVGVTCIIYQFVKRKFYIFYSLAGFLSIFLGELLGRSIFFAVYMTNGLI